MTVRAVQYDKTGGPEVLDVADVPDPQAGPGEVRIRLRAAGLNPVDWKIFGARREPRGPARVGRDFAGTIDQVGPGVTAFHVGEDVLGDTNGTLEEALVVPVDEHLVKKPAGLSFQVAAALPVVGRTAAGALRTLGVDHGDTVLISAASGGVGTIAVQLAKRAGATVLGVASAANADYLRELGAVPVAYGANLAARVREVAPHGVTKVLDLYGPAYVTFALEELGLPARDVVTIAGKPEGADGVRFTGGRDATPDDLPRVAELVAKGEIAVTISGTYGFDRVREAYTRLKRGHVRGKLVLVP